MIVRIHVEQVFGLLIQKYTILKIVLLINLIANNNDNIDECTIDKIEYAVHALTYVHQLYLRDNLIIAFCFY